ncbi:hypothetical protein L208DRAFT_1404411 [Tricholoma matsutake]|nr:hypothetical protein L208DRAFT_1404411 [Tricholoma matsutake 945]
MSRLASFRGPSTPSASPVQSRQTSAPSSPSRLTESTHHRKLRTLLQELYTITQTWEDLVLVDGLKAATNLVDTRTGLDNDISLLSNGLPRSRLVRPKLAIMEKHITELDVVVTKLQRQFSKMVAVVDNLEALLIEAYNTRGWKWVHEQPLWVTWSLEKFVTTASQLVIPYHRSLDMHIELVNHLRSHSVSFDDSRQGILKWVEQTWLLDLGWDAKLGDICDIEIERWGTPR